MPLVSTSNTVAKRSAFFAAVEACVLMAPFFLSFFLSYPSPLPPVWGLGVDPSLQIDVLTELELGESTAGVRQVPGLHNGTKAFLFQGMAQCGAPCVLRGAGPAAYDNLAWRCTLHGAGGESQLGRGVSVRAQDLTLFKWVLPPPFIPRALLLLLTWCTWRF